VISCRMIQCDFDHGNIDCDVLYLYADQYPRARSYLDSRSFWHTFFDLISLVIWMIRQYPAVYPRRYRIEYRICRSYAKLSEMDRTYALRYLARHL
jgi:hypothetical protein